MEAVACDRMPHGRFLLLQNLHFHRPWWSDAASERTWTYLQRVSGDGLQFMSRIAKIQDLTGRARLVDNTEKLTGQQWVSLLICNVRADQNMPFIENFFYQIYNYYT